MGQFLTFRGRIGRSDFWFYATVGVFGVITLLSLFVFGEMVSGVRLLDPVVIGILSTVAMTWVLASAAARRSRDAGYTPWLAPVVVMLPVLLPVLGVPSPY